MFREDIYAAKQLVDKTSELIDAHQGNMDYSILLGLNNVRYKSSSKQTFEDLKTAAIQLRKGTGATVHILQIPPHKNPIYDAQIKWINEKLKTLQNNDAGILWTPVD